MLINIKSRLSEQEIVELISYCNFYDEPYERFILPYMENTNFEIYGYEEDGHIIGVIGFENQVEQNIKVNFLSVDPIERGMGYGRGLILELITFKQPRKIFADVDEDVVEFFRNIGFVIESLGEKLSGFETYRCSYNVQSNE